MRFVREFCLAITTLLFLSQQANSATPEQQNGGSTAILMQGWDWDSAGYGNPDWYTIMRAQVAGMKALGITDVWFPPPSDAAPGPGMIAQGYLPRQLNLLDSAYGSLAELQATISAFRTQGIRAVADIVVNHRVGTRANYGPFTNPDWGGTSAVVGDDDCGYGTPDYVPGCGTGNPDTGWGFNLAPDLDHTNPVVANGIIEYMASLKNIGFTGIRYDYAPGYRAGFEESYTNQFAPDLCVAEVWNKFTDFSAAGIAANVQSEVNFMKGDGSSCNNSSDAYCGGGNQMSCGTFDYTTHTLLVQALKYGNYYLLKNQTRGMTGPAGVIGTLPAMEITFVDNHDTGPAENCDVGQNEDPVPCGDVLQGYAYILTHPGIPEIFYPHVFYWNLGGAISELINARTAAGVNSTSPVAIQTAIRGLYAAIITGTKHQLAMEIGETVGSGSWAPSGGTGWTLAAHGPSYGVWISN